MEAAGDPKKGLKLVNKARKKDKQNEHVYLVRAALYEKLGDNKKRQKALKEAEKVRQKNENERKKMAGKNR